MQRIFEIVAKPLTDFFGIKHLVILRLDPLSSELSFVYSCGFPEDLVQSRRRFKAESGAFKRLIQTRIPQIVNDLQETEGSLSFLIEGQGLKSMIAVPVSSEEKLWGILVLFSQEKARFKEEDARIISLLGGQVGGVLDLFSRYLSDNLDEFLIQILGSIELFRFRYKGRKDVPSSEILWAQDRLKDRVLSCVERLERTRSEAITKEPRRNKEAVLPSGDELSIEEMMTIQGERKAPPRPKKVLVIDDQPIVTELLVNVLERMNLGSAVASGGKEGLELFEREDFDLVITDLGMPDISGWEVSKAVKQKNPDMPVVIITGWGVEPDPEKVKDSKVDFVVNKPFQIDQLEKIITDLLKK